MPNNATVTLDFINLSPGTSYVLEVWAVDQAGWVSRPVQHQWRVVANQVRAGTDAGVCAGTGAGAGAGGTFLPPSPTLCCAHPLPPPPHVIPSAGGRNMRAPCVCVRFL